MERIRFKRRGTRRADSFEQAFDFARLGNNAHDGFVSHVVAFARWSLGSATVTRFAFVPGFSAISGHFDSLGVILTVPFVACEVLTQTLRVTMASNNGSRDLLDGRIIRKIRG